MSGKRPRSEASEPDGCKKRLCLDPDLDSEQAQDRTECPYDTIFTDTQGIEPLTTANLRRLQRQITPAMNNGQLPPGKRSRQISPTKSGFASTVASTNNVPLHLNDFGIYIKRGKPMPTDLRKLFDGITTSHPGPYSPNAGIVVKRQLGAQMMGEADGIDLLRKLLLGEGAIEASDDAADSQGISHALNVNLSRTFLPTSRIDIPDSALKSPQPDSSFGYLLTEIATRCQLTSVFSEDDECILRYAQVCKQLHFPFFTCQWKSNASGGSHTEAQQQGARDGATIVNSTYSYLKNARPGQEPSAAETCHFSATCDMLSIYLYIHWRHVDGAKMTYEMDRVGSTMALDDETSVRKARDIIKNIAHWAKTQRLEVLKAAIPGYTNTIVAQSTNSQLLTPSIESSTAPNSKRQKLSGLNPDAIVAGSVTSLPFGE